MNSDTWGVKFTPIAWEEYMEWQTQDKKTLKRINALIRDIKRDPFNGIGKPEALKHHHEGKYSRRIDDYNRLIYTAADDTIIIYSVGGHYE